MNEERKAFLFYESSRNLHFKKFLQKFLTLPYLLLPQLSWLQLTVLVSIEVNFFIHLHFVDVQTTSSHSSKGEFFLLLLIFCGGDERRGRLGDISKIAWKILLHKKILNIRSTTTILSLVFIYYIICLRNKKLSLWLWRNSYFCVKRLVLMDIQLIKEFKPNSRPYDLYKAKKIYVSLRLPNCAW